MGKWSRLMWSLTSDSCSRLSPSLLQISTKMIFDASRDILTTQIWWRRGFSHMIALIQLRRWKTRSCYQRKSYFQGFVINTSKMLNMNTLTFWQTFGYKIVADYHNLYLKTRSYPPIVFQNFRKVWMNKYKLDPPWYFTSPGLAWDAAVKKTGITLDLLRDPDMLLKFEKGIKPDSAESRWTQEIVYYVLM